MKKLNHGQLFYKLSRYVLTLALIAILTGCGEGGDSSSSDSSTGQAGSMARFSIVDNYLYTIAGSRMQLFDITDPSAPVAYAQIFVDWSIETIFSYQDALFIGAQQGVFIYDNSDPSNPQYSSEFTHATSCDPVVVSNSYAYITLRDGNSCFQGLNQMDILDVSDIYNPMHMKTLAMQNPKGLGVDQNRLFVCDGIAGLKMFDLSDPVLPVLVNTEAAVDCYDLIANNGLLIINDKSGILQYEYDSTTPDITLLGSILMEI